MNIIAWILIIGVVIKIGSILLSYFVSINNFEASNNLYEGWDLSIIYQQSFVHYSFIEIGKVLLLAIHAYIIFLAACFLKSFNFTQPFNYNLLIALKKINRSILNLWFATIIFNIHLVYLKKYTTFLIR